MQKPVERGQRAPNFGWKLRGDSTVHSCGRWRQRGGHAGKRAQPSAQGPALQFRGSAPDLGQAPAAPSGGASVCPPVRQSLPPPPTPEIVPRRSRR